MTDDDIASDREEKDREAALQARKPAGPAPTGFCLYCGNPLLDAGARWCDAGCRDDWQREQARGVR